MATRIQSLVLGFGVPKESSYNTASASFARFTKIDTSITSQIEGAETDAAWIGKGTEFFENAYPTAADASNRIQKYGGVEWMTYVLAYGLGDVSSTGTSYTITAADPSTSLQLPSFSICEQLPEGGGMAIDHMYQGCCVEDFDIKWEYGPGLKSVSTEMAWRGSGVLTSPSGISVPATTTEHNALAAGMSLTINGVDYVAAATGMTGSLTWKNNLLADQGYFVGSGLDASGRATRARLEYGARSAQLQFTARLLSTSTEFTKLKALTTGTAVINFQFDSSHKVQITLEKIVFTKVENTNAEGLATVNVTADVGFDSTNGVVSVAATCPLTGIAG